MCGRITRTTAREAIAEESGVARFVNVDLQPRYNVAPSHRVDPGGAMPGRRSPCAAEPRTKKS